jgi:hypothetical protein
MTVPSFDSSFTNPRADQAQLLEQLLDPLLNDMAESFERGLVLLEDCPESILSLAEQQRLLAALLQARGELRAARSLRAALPHGIGLDMNALTPWHRLVLEVWTLSSRLRTKGLRP